MSTQNLPQLVRSMLLGYRSAVTWGVTGELFQTTVQGPPLPPGNFCIGRSTGLQWSGSGPSALVPDTLATHDEAWVRGLKAAYAFDPPPSLDRLEKTLRTRWVRLSIDQLRDQGWLSAAQQFDDLMYMVTDDAVAACREVEESTQPSSITVVCANHTWRLYPHSGIWTTAQLGHYYANVRFQYGDAASPPSIPRAEDVISYDRLLEETSIPHARKTTSTSPDINPPDGGTTTWSVTHASLDKLLGVASCVHAQRLVSTTLRQDDKQLARRIEFDSEGSLFAAYCGSQTDALALVAIIDRLISERQGRH